MNAGASNDLYAASARLDEVAVHAGCVMACTHQSADELHRDAIERYFAARPRRRPLSRAMGVAAVAVLFTLL